MLEVLYQNSIITLKTFNLFLALGFLFGGAFCIRYCEKHKMNLAFLSQYFLPLLMAAVFGGRLFYFFENWAIMSDNLISVLHLWNLNQYSFFGILFGLFVALFFLARRRHEDFWAWVDASALTTLGVLIFTHLGFFFSGRYYGEPTTLPWGIAFDASHIPYLTPLHPIQLYAAFLTIILLGYSVKRSKRIHLSGVVGTWAIMLYSLHMLGIDFLRGDPTHYTYTKIVFAVLAALSFIASVHCSHKTHSSTS